MKTTELKKILKPFFDEAEQVCLTKVISEQRIDAEEVTIVKFIYDGYKLFAVIYDDGTCFTPDDWSINYESIEDVDGWIDQRFKIGIVLNGLPRQLV